MEETNGFAMSSIEQLIDELLSKGIGLYEGAGQLKVKAPKGALSSLDAENIKSNKEALLAYLQRERQRESAGLSPIMALDENRNDCFELSSAQRRLWTLDQIQGQSPEYNIPVFFKISGEFDCGRAERVMAGLIQQHAILRTIYLKVDGVPKQKILRDFQFEFLFKNLEDTEPALTKVEQQLEFLAAKPFNLSEDLPLRAGYLQYSNNQGIFFFVVHHIAADGFSLNLLIEQFIEGYYSNGSASASAGDELSVDNVSSVRFVDYAAWEHKQHGRWQSAREYWREQLLGAPLVHSLPLDFPRHREPGGQADKLQVELDKTLVQHVDTLARHYGLTRFMVFNAALAWVLTRFSFASEIVLGTPVANRLAPETQTMIGCFINTVALRISSRFSRIADFLQHVREINLQAQEHQALSFSEVIEECKVPRSVYHSPVFQILINYEETGIPHADKNAVSNENSLVIEPFELAVSKAVYDLELNVIAAGDTLTLSWLYKRALFQKETLTSIQSALIQVLHKLSVDENALTNSLELAAPDLKAEKVAEIIASEKQDEPQMDVLSLFRNQLRLAPEATALEDVSGVFSYLQLDRLSNALAQELIDKGLSPGEFVAVVCERRVSLVIALLAVVKTGAAYIPIDPDYPAARIEFMLESAGVKRVLVDSAVTKDKLDIEEDGYFLVNSDPISVDDEDEKGSLAFSPDLINRAATAYVIFTSGSTGQPKGVEISHQALGNFIQAMVLSLDDAFSKHTRLLALTTICFDIAQLEIWGPLTTGGRIVMASENEVADPFAIARLIQEKDITLVQATPATWNLLLESQWQGKRDLHALCGGEALTVDLAGKMLDRCQRLDNCYGPTEATIWSMVSQVSKEDLRRGEILLTGNLKNYSHVVLDENQNIAAAGAVGELCIGGLGLAKGYLNQPELSRARFFEKSFNERAVNRLYRTGDLVRALHDGRYAFLGRTDDQIKVRGFRIELGEIESALLGCEELQAAKVVAASDSAGETRIQAYVIFKPQFKQEESNTLLQNLRAKIGRVLPEYMLPAFMIPLEEWPLTPNGKIDKKSLPDPLLQMSAKEIVPAKPGTESVLLECWAEVLGVKPEKISVDANFFELGGHSLLLIKMLTRVNQKLNVEMHIGQFIEEPTIAALARNVEIVLAGRYLQVAASNTEVMSEGIL